LLELQNEIRKFEEEKNNIEIQKKKKQEIERELTELQNEVRKFEEEKEHIELQKKLKEQTENELFELQEKLKIEKEEIEIHKKTKQETEMELVELLNQKKIKFDEEQRQQQIKETVISEENKNAVLPLEEIEEIKFKGIPNSEKRSVILNKMTEVKSIGQIEMLMNSLYGKTTAPTFENNSISKSEKKHDKEINDEDFILEDRPRSYTQHQIKKVVSHDSTEIEKLYYSTRWGGIQHKFETYQKLLTDNPEDTGPLTQKQLICNIISDLINAHQNPIDILHILSVYNGDEVKHVVKPIEDYLKEKIQMKKKKK